VLDLTVGGATRRMKTCLVLVVAWWVGLLACCSGCYNSALQDESRSNDKVTELALDTRTFRAVHLRVYK
jgi:hypothetical protein